MGFRFWVLLGLLIMNPRPATADLFLFTDGEGRTYYTNIPGEDRVKVALPVKTASPHSSSPTPAADMGKTYEPIIDSASQTFSVDPDLVRAVIKAESNYDPRAVSPKGAMGLMQLMPETARRMAVVDPLDPEQNIRGGVRYLSELLGLLNGRMTLALAAYNAGPGKVLERNGIPAIKETKHYIQKVLHYYRNLKSKTDLSRP